MTVSTYLIEHQSEDMTLKCRLRLDRAQLSDALLRDVLGCTGSIDSAIAEAGGDVELAVAQRAKTAAVYAAYCHGALLGAERGAASELKRADGWCADGLDFEFLEIDLDVDDRLTTLTKEATEEPAQ